MLKRIVAAQTRRIIDVELSVEPTSEGAEMTRGGGTGESNDVVFCGSPATVQHPFEVVSPLAVSEENKTDKRVASEAAHARVDPSAGELEESHELLRHYTVDVIKDMQPSGMGLPCWKHTLDETPTADHNNPMMTIGNASPKHATPMKEIPSRLDGVPQGINDGEENTKQTCKELTGPDVLFSPCAGGFDDELPAAGWFKSTATDGNDQDGVLRDADSGREGEKPPCEESADLLFSPCDGSPLGNVDDERLVADRFESAAAKENGQGCVGIPKEGL